MELNLVAAAARRRWRVMLSLFLIGPILAVALLITTPAQYRSTATVLFGISGAQSVREVVDAGTYVQDVVPSYSDLATTPVVMNRVIDELGLRVSAAELAHQVTVDSRAQSVLVDIAAVGGSASGAAELANSVAKQLGVVVPELSASGDDPKALPVTVAVVSPAQPASAPFSPNVGRTLLLGLFGGLALAAIYLYLREAIASTVRTREDVAEVTDAPVVATLVRDPRSRLRQLPVDSHPHVSRAESFRMFRTNVLPRLDQNVVVLVVVSPGEGDGRTSTVANLAVAIAHTGRRVLVIDADLRHPQLAATLSLPGHVGLSNLLSGETDLSAIVQQWRPQRWSSHTVDVIAAGPAAENASELLGSPLMTTLLDRASKNYDVVLVDTPPLLQVTDGALMAAQADAALVVVDTRTTESRDLEEAFQRLIMAGAPVLGVALNNTPDARKSRARDTARGERRRRRAEAASELSAAASGQGRPDGVGQGDVPESWPGTILPTGAEGASDPWTGPNPVTPQRNRTAPLTQPGGIPEVAPLDAAVITNNLELDEIRRQVASIKATTPGRRSRDRRPQGGSDR